MKIHRMWINRFFFLLYTFNLDLIKKKGKETNKHVHTLIDSEFSFFRRFFQRQQKVGELP